MEILLKKKLSTGEELQIIHWCSSEPAPEKYVNYVIASFGIDYPKSNLYDLGNLRAYFRDAMSGIVYPEIVDHWFFAEVDGECAGRIWFAYSSRTAHGNFGNVQTEPRFRKRGIMSELLKCCMAEFQKSPAKVLTCCTGNPSAALAYKSVGFEMVYGGTTGKMSISKSGFFRELEKKAFDGSPLAVVRDGKRGDQFDCDKFLAVADRVSNRDIYEGPQRVGASKIILEYRHALFAVLGGYGFVKVMENRVGTIVGYAFAVMAEGSPVIDFTCHPDYYADMPKILKKIAIAFKERFQLSPLYRCMVCTQ